jgi:phospholipid/cholesterol/gamma-HCH transport system substrate-binding protein
MAVPTAALRSHNTFETIVSAAVIAVALAFLGFIILRTGTGRLGSYALSASVPDATGLTVNADVRLGGVKVGAITGLDLEPGSYRAIVHFQIRDDLFLPVDSGLGITSPQMGNPYLSIQPGHSQNRIAPGGQFPAPQRSGKVQPKRAPSH